MDLDFKSVKALASPTRLEILNKVLDEEATTTKLSDELDKSKSTVSNHLKVLTESGLLEKDQEDGRRRVIYRPTSKARAIVEGKERKVKFSVVSSALTAVGGIFLLNRSITEIFTQKSAEPAQALNSRSADAMGTMDAENSDMMIQSADVANQTANATSNAAPALQNFQMEQAMIVIGAGLLVTSVMAIGYSYILRKLRN